MNRIKYIMFLIIGWCICISNIERVGNLAAVHATQVTVNDVKTKDNLENLLRGTGEFERTDLNTWREILKEILNKS